MVIFFLARSYDLHLHPKIEKGAVVMISYKKKNKHITIGNIRKATFQTRENRRV